MSRRKVRLEAGNYILIGDTGSHYSIFVPKEMATPIEEEAPVDEIQSEAGMEFAMPDYIGGSVERNENPNGIPIPIPPVEPNAELLRQMEQLRADIDRFAGEETNDDNIDAFSSLLQTSYPEMIQREQERRDAVVRDRIQAGINEDISAGRINLISTPQHPDTHLQQMMRRQQELNEAHQQVVEHATFHGGAVRRGPIQAEHMPAADMPAGRYEQEYQQRPEGNFNTDRSTNIELKKRKMAQAKAGETSED